MNTTSAPDKLRQIDEEVVSWCFSIRTLEILTQKTEHGKSFNEILPGFAYLLTEALWHYAVLTYSRLMQRQSDNNQTNICLESMVNVLCEHGHSSLANETQDRLKQIKRTHTDLVILRHKFFAHRDADYASGKKCISPVSTQDLRNAATSVIEVLDPIRTALVGSQMTYWMPIVPTDANTLLMLLNRAENYTKLFHDADTLEEDELRSRMWAEFRQGPWRGRRKR